MCANLILLPCGLFILFTSLDKFEVERSDGWFFSKSDSSEKLSGDWILRGVKRTFQFRWGRRK